MKSKSEDRSGIFYRWRIALVAAIGLFLSYIPIGSFTCTLMTRLGRYRKWDVAAGPATA